MGRKTVIFLLVGIGGMAMAENTDEEIISNLDLLLTMQEFDVRSAQDSEMLLDLVKDDAPDSIVGPEQEDQTP